ncbi:LysR family transcriptional regulator [Affinibrenneria salicis]|uniref:LysR family transcriptional regulator n=1 Tax=Affinibrenneria salicis TaxID=2590031 RepID=A0A5J5G4X3_9GAMM|nr:LysR family transcriptional regulator [Affinibrenneria salicis]KAA9001264.1 LysR family transcriptional regulator [Affinibrenneria salicis]
MLTDVRTLDLNLLKTLDALLDERSVTRAAQRLALTQPAVSGMLTRLRNDFNDPLFVRTKQGIVPTLRALELACPIKQILSDADALLRPQAFDPASAALTLTIASSDYALQAVVIPFIAALRRQAPAIRVSLQSAKDAQLQARFERGEIDIALISPDSTPPGLHARHLFYEDYVCLLRADHPDAAGDRLSMARFCALDHVLVSYSGGKFNGVTDEMLARQGRERRVAMSVTSFAALPEILSASDLIAVVPQRLARAYGDGLKILAPPFAIRGFTQSVVWHERTERDPARRWLRALLIDGCAD